jgi:origin recognition complex subunit 5
VIVNVLEKRGIPYALLRSRECLTQRHLLSKIFASCVSAFEIESQIEQYDRIDSINALMGNLRKPFERVGQRRFVIVIEGIDRLKQAGPTLLPALARLGDQVYSSGDNGIEFQY